MCSGPSGKDQSTSALHVGGASLPGLVSPATSGLTKTNDPDVNSHLRETKEEQNLGCHRRLSISSLNH